MRPGPLHRPLLSAFVVALFLPVFGCDLEPSNPNNPSEDQVLTTEDGLRNLTVGLQELYATNALDATITTTSVTSRELAVNTTFANLVELEEGGAGDDLSSSNASVEQIWSANYRIVRTAEDILANAPDVGFREGTESGVVATARLFKAMALGNISMAFEQGATTAGEENPAFVARQEVLQEAVNQLNMATATLEETPPSDEFENDVLAIESLQGDTTPNQILRNVIDAYRARFNLLAGNDQAAIDAANQVDPSVQPVFNYNDQSQNPVWDAVVQDGDFAPRDSFGTRLTEPGDERIGFFTNPLDNTSTPSGFPIDAINLFTSSSSPFPLYLTGEMPLIRAEAKLNQGETLSDVISEIDAVRTKSSGEDPFGVGANLGPFDGPQTEAALREEILRQRRAELSLQGLSLADTRRLGPEVSNRDDPGPFEQSRNFYPYPDQERRNNPNTPADPDF